MRRREFIRLLGVAAAGWSLAARAQPRDRVRLVGLLWGFAADDPEWQRRFAAFAGRLQELGWIEGKNVAFVPKYAVGNPDLFSAMADDLVQKNVDVIVTATAGLASLARKVTSTTPIVVAVGGELEGTGLIETVRRPGGNVTGNQTLNPELMSKRVGLLKQLVPNLTRLGIVVPVTSAAIISSSYMEHIAEATRALQIQPQEFRVYSPDQFGAAVSMIARECQAAIVLPIP